MPTLEQRRSRCYDIAKAFCVLLVVLGHAAVFYTPDGARAPARDSAVLAGLADYIYSFHMPLFVALSGCVYGYCIRHGKYAQALPFLLGKARRLLVPYLVFGLALVAPVVVFCGYVEEDFLSYCLHGILLGYDARHLWYLLTLFTLFLIAPLARPLAVRQPLWLLPICAALFLAAGFVPELLKLQTSCRYALFFFGGVCCDRYYPQLEALARKLRYLLPLLPIALLSSVFWNPNFVTETAYTLLGMAMILAFASLLTGSEAIQRSRLYRLLKRDGFGIYLFHAMLIYLAFHFLGATQIPPAALFALSAAGSFVVSAAATQLLRKLRLGILIGE